MPTRATCFFILLFACLTEFAVSVPLSSSEDKRFPDRLQPINAGAGLSVSADEPSVGPAQEKAGSYLVDTPPAFLQDATAVRRARVPVKQHAPARRPGRAAQLLEEFGIKKPSYLNQPARPRPRIGSEPDLVGLARAEAKMPPPRPTPPNRVPPIYTPGKGVEDPGRLKPPSEYEAGLKKKAGRSSAAAPAPAAAAVSRQPPPPAVTPRPALGEDDWPTMENIEPVPYEDLLEGKERIGAIVKEIESRRSSGLSFLQEVNARLTRPSVRSTIEEEQAEGDNGDIPSGVLWNKDAVKTWSVPKRRNPKRFVRPADVPAGVHALKWLYEQGVEPDFDEAFFLGEEQGDQLSSSTGAFLQFADRWTPKRGFELALEKFWPKERNAEAKAEDGRTVRFRMHETLGMGSFGAVARIENTSLPASDPDKFVAGKFMYEYCDAQMPKKNSEEHMKDGLKTELEVRDKILAALENVPDQKGKPLVDKLRYLIASGVATPQVTYEVRKTDVVNAVIGAMWESPPKQTGSPLKQLLRFSTTVLTYPLVGPDLTELFEHRISNAARAFMVYKLVKNLANFEKLGFTHNDLKPANFLARRDGELLIADLGLVEKIGDVFPCLNCTAIYLDPQSAKCAFNDEMRKATPKRDAWALGATLFNFLCSNDLPYDGENLFRKAKMIVGEDERPVIGYLALISKVKRSDWTQIGCPRGIPSLWSILKMLLDPVEESRKTALELSGHPFFNVRGL